VSHPRYGGDVTHKFGGKSKSKRKRRTIMKKEMTVGRGQEVLNADSFWKVMLEDEKPEISIRGIDIYSIQMSGQKERFGLFRNYVPVTEEVEDAWGTHGGVQPTLQDAVDVALLHEFMFLNLG
tara:strand:- start:1562 stop:1930 length:369 start_codon:yes stop_codon:yes gene_type:complete